MRGVLPTVVPTTFPAREHAEAAAVRGRPRTLQVEERGELAQVVAPHVVVVCLVSATVSQADGELVGVECLRELQTPHSLVELVRLVRGSGSASEISAAAELLTACTRHRTRHAHAIAARRTCGASEETRATQYSCMRGESSYASPPCRLVESTWLGLGLGLGLGLAHRLAG